MFKKLRSVIYHVNDLDQAKIWYQEITGIAPYFEEKFYVGFEINGSELGLDPDLDKIIPGNNSVAYWSVDNIEDKVEALLKKGALVIDEVKEVGGGIKVAIIKDPFGNAVGLIEEV
ncbi:MAG: VOC family protein [Chitinophagaceae bacterium]|nr:VOC family protein [Chitinophagaceae bacterium]